MTIAQLLPWFPILLGVGVGGRLLGRARGAVLGGVGALFWIVLIQASSGTHIWTEGWALSAISLGAIAITLMGAWSGQHTKDSVSGGTSVTSANGIAGESFFRPPSGIERRERRSKGADAVHDPSQLVHLLERITGVCRRFDGWVHEHRDCPDLWPAFGEFVREVLFQTCRATHVKPYRMHAETGAWMPLRVTDDEDAFEKQVPHLHIVNNVVETRCSFVDAADRVERTSLRPPCENRPSSESLAWCFAIRSGENCLGLVTVGRFEANPPPAAFRESIEQIVGMFWRTIAEASVGRSAETHDGMSGLLNRTTFIQQAEAALRDSQHQGEPSAVAMIAIHGLRELNDGGKWEIADELIREVGRALREKVRLDDRLGRFDGSRFVWLLRRVDAGLAIKIVRQVMSRLEALCGDRERWQASIAVRCGLVGGGLEAKGLRTLVSQALVQSRRARTENIAISSGLSKTRSLSTEGALI